MKIRFVLGALLLGITLPSLAADLPPNYVGAMGSYVFPDSVRNDKNGPGAALLFGYSLTPALSTEVNLFGNANDQKTGNKTDHYYGGGLDLRYLVGNNDLGGFVVGGIGGVLEDYAVGNNRSPYVNLGLGMLYGLSSSWQLRGEVREYAMANKTSYAGSKGQHDTRVNIGIQYAFLGTAAPADSDNDGVADSADACPDTPAGTEVDATGCPVQTGPVDSDNDGVLDSDDQCPNTPAGAKVDATGCNADNDGDGVLNDADNCPDTPPNFKVDEHGCVLNEQTVVVLNSVHFEFDSARLTGEARRLLDRVVAGLKGQPTMKVMIEGHTDSIGSERYNQQLSTARAESVRNFLITEGVEPDRLEAKGFGESSPIADNSTEEGRAQNRRVDFKVTAK